MRILILTNYFYPEIGAAPSRIYNMAKGLIRKNNSVEVISPMPNYPTGKIFKNYKNKLFNSELINGIKTYQYFIYPSKSSNPILRLFSMCSFAVSFWFSIFHLMNKKQIDLVIIQNSPLLVSFSGIILFKKIFGRKIVLNISDLWPGSAVDLGVIGKGLTYKILKKIEHFNYKNSDAFLGQSQVILDEIKFFIKKPNFLYRNLQPDIIIKKRKYVKRKKLIYAGLLGVAQDVLGIIKNVNFKKISLDFHIYGDGNQKKEILEFIKKSNLTNIKYFGLISKRELLSQFKNYDFSIAPLKTNIKGAVPSKIFECINNTIPIIYLGKGEASKIINKYKVGYVLEPGDYNNLEHLLKEISNISNIQYEKLIENCYKAKLETFNFEKQIIKLNLFLNEM